MLSFERLEDRSLLSAGDLDLTFGTGGTVTTDINELSDSAASVAIQSDGKIVVAGSTLPTLKDIFFDFAVVRYNADGTLDTSFGADGIATFDFGGSDLAASVAIDDSGRIVVAGVSQFSGGKVTTSGFAVARLNTDGTLDTGFGGDGVSTVEFGVKIGDPSVAIDDTGRIIVAGHSVQDAITGGDFAVARLNDDGTLDASFSGDGKTTIDFGSSEDFAHSVAVDGSGRIVVAGYSDQGATGYDFAIARLNDNGMLDTTFSDDGKATVDFGSFEDLGYSAAIDDSGRFVVAGYSDQWATGYDLAVARLNDDGTLDTSFGGDGKATVDFSSNGEISTDVGHSVAIDGSGRIVVAGESDLGPGTMTKVINNDFAVARLNDDGTLDASFSGDGKATIDFGGPLDNGYSVAIDANGRIVVAGESYQGATTGGLESNAMDFAVARLDGGTLTPPQVIDLLDNRIDELVADGQLTEGQGNSLKAKLLDILDKIDADRWNAVAGKLNAFINQVEAWDGSILTHEDAEFLIGLAGLILQEQP
ncbi:MAG: delta-60 repeat domain-containing protein [Pirellulales bacterium]